MADAKIYLNVPYAQKDAAKALGARWDPAQKKWYVLADKDLSLFAQWHSATSASPAATAPQASTATAPKAATGVMTYALDKNFVAYDGDAPPWA